MMLDTTDNLTGPIAANSPVQLDNLIGNTPLLRLDRTADLYGLAPDVQLLAKASFDTAPLGMAVALVGAQLVLGLIGLASRQKLPFRRSNFLHTQTSKNNMTLLLYPNPLT